MTDPFEEAVRRAAQGLHNDPTYEQPTYHDAWQRGRRRRFRKQAGVAFAGAFVLLAALTVNLGGFPGGSTEVSEVADDAPATTTVPTTPEFVPTTPPVASPPIDESAASSPRSTAVPEAAGSAPAESVVTVEPTPDPVASAAVAPAEVAATSTPVPPAAAAAEQSPAAETPTPETDLSATDPTAPAGSEPDESTQDATTEPPVTAFDVAPTTIPDGTSTAQTGPIPPDGEEERTLDEPGAETGLTAAIPNVVLIGPNQRADAIVLDQSDGQTSSGLACDIDRDGQADATCTLMPRYACTGAAEARPGYTPVDFDEDGEFDTCVAGDTTACDTTSDGFADTPCTIELLPVEVDPEDS